MKVVIETDLEGISGVCVWEQTRDRTTLYYQEARRLLMGDINAAVEGCLAAGVNDILVVDGHGGGFNIVPELMHPKARYLSGVARPPMTERTAIRQGVDGAILLGYHAMAGTPDGVLRHTQSSKQGRRYWYNDRESGEIAQTALYVGHMGIPVIMVTGDAATCREAHDFLGPDIITVAVKESYDEQFSAMLAPEAAHDAIRTGALEAIERIGRCHPYTIDLPIRGRMAYGSAAFADVFEPKRSKRIDDVTFEATFDTALEIYDF